MGDSLNENEVGSLDKSDSNNSIREDDISEGKNAKSLICQFCNCLILKPQHASFANVTKELPALSQKSGEEFQNEALTGFWLVENIYNFENMGFSRTVDDIKYLACAECDVGPLGWHDLKDKKCYVSLSRIKSC